MPLFFMHRGADRSLFFHDGEKLLFFCEVNMRWETIINQMAYNFPENFFVIDELAVPWQK